MQTWFLEPHVHLCFTDDHAVLLDLARDKYLGLGPEQTRALAGRIAGWPQSQDGPADESRAAGVLKRMRADGLITQDRDRGKPASAPELAIPRAPLIEPDLDARPRPRAREILRFITASVTTRVSLRTRPILSVVQRARARKLRASAKAGGLDLKLARGPVEAFLYLRPLLFSAYDQCLYDSCALVEYLAGFDLYPTWVFGVRTRPFLAHSWVQYEDVVFNDTPEYVGRFTPILTI